MSNEQRLLQRVLYTTAEYTDLDWQAYGLGVPDQTLQRLWQGPAWVNYIGNFGGPVHRSAGLYSLVEVLQQACAERMQLVPDDDSDTELEESDEDEEGTVFFVKLTDEQVPTAALINFLNATTIGMAPRC